MAGAVNEPDLEVLVLLELYLDTDPNFREEFLADLDDDTLRRLLALIVEETGAMP